MAAEETSATADGDVKPSEIPAKKPAPGRTISTTLKPVEKAKAPPRAAKAAPKAKAPPRAAKAAKTAPKAKAPPRAAKAAKTALAEPAKPTDDQIALWQSLNPDQRLALREREAVRLFSQGLEHHQKGDLAEAVKLYGQALVLNQAFPDIYNNMGVALRALGKLEASAACYQRSLALKPGHAPSYANLGNVLRDLGRLEIAAASHRKAVEMTPDEADSHYNLGLSFRDLGDNDEALACFQKTLELNPDHPDCRWDRSLSLLQKGELKEGFEEYEWRWKLSSNPPREFSQPLWDGSELGGKTILLHQEQGLGDMIHFARYIPMVKERGGTVIVETQPNLARLFSTIEGVGQVVNVGSALPKFDVYLPMMSLARVFGTTLETIPATIPYLKPPDAHATQLPASLGKERKIGIAWAGRPTHKNDSRRSCPFRHFVELMGVGDTRLYSLQTGAVTGDIAENGCQALVMDVGSKMGDFAEIAGVIAELDLVVTVDTSFAHLAGAMGKPVWVVLSRPGDWRWMLDRDDSPWYPSARLFRQEQPGDWDGVFERLRRALADEVKG